MSGLAGRALNNRIRLHAGRVFLSEQTDDTPCKCCAFECVSELSIEVSFCGMTAVRAVPIPGILDGNQIETLPDGSYLIVSAQIACGPCGWALDIGVCGYCESTQEAASDGFTALIPFAATAEAGGGYCPEPGFVDLTCFGEQFGIPCVTNTTAEIG